MKAKRKLVFALLAIVFFVSTGLFVQLYWQEFNISDRIYVFALNQTERAALAYAEKNSNVADWPEWVAIGVSRARARNPETTATGSDRPLPPVLNEYKQAYADNRDIIGWIEIEGTKIDYAVMQTKGDNEYYLHRDSSGNYLYEGTPFLDASSDVLLPSANFLVYGHNMINKTLFGSLPSYLDEAYYQEHQTIKFDTIYEKGEYEVIAVFLSQVYYHNDPVFRYYIWGMIDNESDFNYYINNVMALSVYDTGKTAEWGDQLLTLSTCYYHVYEGRMVVVAKKIN